MQRLILASTFTDYLDNVTGEGDEDLEQATTVGCVVDRRDKEGGAELASDKCSYAISTVTA
eukprot:scaffold7642_cov80-Skeletonema_dohrnii-CCMP3373.AAC.1